MISRRPGGAAAGEKRAAAVGEEDIIINLAKLPFHQNNAHHHLSMWLRWSQDRSQHSTAQYSTLRLFGTNKSFDDNTRCGPIMVVIVTLPCWLCALGGCGRFSWPGLPACTGLYGLKAPAGPAAPRSSLTRKPARQWRSYWSAQYSR